MPVKIPNTLPARATLERENIFIMDEERAIHQDIRPLRVAILNLMPTKITTETQLLRLLSNSALQVEVTLLHTATHEARNTDADHLLNHYLTFEDLRSEKFDGLIVTGAPVEQMPFEEVDYWSELTQVFDWAETNVESLVEQDDAIAFGVEEPPHLGTRPPTGPAMQRNYGQSVGMAAFLPIELMQVADREAACLARLQ
jgi:homoserine O-succinyltransferase